jgi:hypothetical protein
MEEQDANQQRRSSACSWLCVGVSVRPHSNNTRLRTLSVAASPNSHTAKRNKKTQKKRRKHRKTASLARARTKDVAYVLSRPPAAQQNGEHNKHQTRSNSTPRSTLKHSQGPHAARDAETGQRCATKPETHETAKQSAHTLKDGSQGERRDRPSCFVVSEQSKTSRQSQCQSRRSNNQAADPTTYQHWSACARCRRSTELTKSCMAHWCTLVGWHGACCWSAWCSGWSALAGTAKSTCNCNIATHVLGCLFITHVHV